MRSTSVLNQDPFQSVLSQMTQIKVDLANLLQTSGQSDVDSKSDDVKLQALTSDLKQIKDSLNSLSRISMDLSMADARDEERREECDPESKKEKIFIVNRFRLAYRLEQAHISILALKLFNQCYLRYGKLVDEKKEIIFKEMMKALFPFPDQFTDHLLSSAIVLDLAEYSTEKLGNYSPEKLGQLASLSTQLGQLVQEDGEFLMAIEAAAKSMEEIRAKTRRPARSWSC